MPAAAMWILPIAAILATCTEKSNEIQQARMGNMNMKESHLLWTAEAREYPGEKEYLFLFDPVMGLMDIDSHRITDSGWTHLQASDAESTAHLVVPPFATLKELDGALETLSTKGAFKRVRITVRPL